MDYKWMTAPCGIPLKGDPRVIDIRKLGSAGLETAWVAAGKGEAYFTTMIEPWDVAPGVLLVQEAGGKVSDFQGNPWQPQTGDLLFRRRKVAM